jgi:hypothetical protein
VDSGSGGGETGCLIGSFCFEEGDDCANVFRGNDGKERGRYTNKYIETTIERWKTESEVRKIYIYID